MVGNSRSGIFRGVPITVGNLGILEISPMDFYRAVPNHGREFTVGNFPGVSIRVGNLGIPDRGRSGFYTNDRPPPHTHIREDGTNKVPKTIFSKTTFSL